MRDFVYALYEIATPWPTEMLLNTHTSQITSLTIVYSRVYWGADKKHQSSGSLAFVRGSHRWPVNSPRKRPVTRKMFPFDDVIMWRMWPHQGPVWSCRHTSIEIPIVYIHLRWVYCCHVFIMWMPITGEINLITNSGPGLEQLSSGLTIFHIIHPWQRYENRNEWDYIQWGLLGY